MRCGSLIAGQPPSPLLPPPVVVVPLAPPDGAGVTLDRPWLSAPWPTEALGETGRLALSLGLSLGPLLGPLLGDSLGLSDGVSLGVSLGVALGVSDGVSDGVGDGVCEGVCDFWVGPGFSSEAVSLSQGRVTSRSTTRSSTSRPAMIHGQREVGL